ncbi:bacillithiol biosynthesis deacetylase BshB1 [Bacillus shivajii]|uniref:bacillithiol biosynthesis deacetylase BshB1 n=1 Tax=Bacillus shivajii TaxID=1983719 RepID=UPI001CFAB783|nr:bacillithiol biosynthesis deacetylase BshB1 [Bacillus shivajii]UCZ55287.1 bacillithiol biosynthesis deacetylase BshB1 [Bacillus shivajii]
MNEQKLDMLAIGAHPDDVEIGMGGTIAKYAKMGFRIGIINLTKAELSSNGTVETRQKEAEHAAEVLGLEKRIQLSFPDRGLKDSSKECIEEVVKVIRKYQPKVIFAPNKHDRHPDHGYCSEIVKEAHFSSGIKRYLPENQAYRAEQLYYYQINGIGNPTFIVDIADFIDVKIEALACFKTQFRLEEGTVKTPLNENYLEKLKSREMLLGNEAGVKYGEGFTSDRPIIMSHILGENV